MELKISYGNNRFSKKWSNKKITFEELCERFKNTRRTTETVFEYKKLSRNRRDEIKDVGGFVLGHLKGGRRKKETVESRSGITLDADYANVNFLKRLEGRFSCVVYSTHKHTSENPRFRLVVPITREVTPDEYSALSRLVAEEIGMDYFDDSTYEPERLMYWPSTPSDGEYIFKIFDGRMVNPDMYLQKLSDWRDCWLWPTSSRQSEVIKRKISKQQDPLSKTGIVGTFCRTYGIETAITEFLSDVYTPSVIDGRYDYIAADSSAGVVIYEDKWSYSHHATDPASNKLLNAFDIVRIHKFGDLEEKASFNAMADFASKDEKVKLLIAEERKIKAQADFNNKDWEKQLQYESRSTILKNSLHNITLILENDEAIKGIVFNQLADGLEIKSKVPWNHPARFWRDADDAQLISYVDSHYGAFSARNYQIAVTKVTDDRSYHPIREYLNSLPTWDGIPRIETLLIDYLGAEDDEYVRAVTRKTLCAAIARVLTPGIKFDNILVLNGAQGVGKSTLILKLGGVWYSDSLSLTDMNDKTAAEKLQGYWLLEIGELAGMRKADIDKVKAFISRQDDKYRASFGRRVTPHPRQCIFFGTTNSEKGYLRDVTGNRRFWTVKTPGSNEKQPWQLTNEEIGQIWAEVLRYVKKGERLYLEADLEKLSKREQRDAMEQDEREGLVREYLDKLLPENWNDMDIYSRQEYIRSPDDPTLPKGMTLRQVVCNMEIWCECFGKQKEDMKPIDSHMIATIMEHIDNWVKTGKYTYFRIYGKQRIYSRTEQL